MDTLFQPLVPKGNEVEPKQVESELKQRAHVRDRATNYIYAFAGTLADGGAEAHPKLAQFISALGPIGMFLWSCCVWAAEAYWICYKAVYDVSKVLPWNVIQMIFGIALCFFGGTFLASIAAIEAFRCLGGKQVWESLCTVWTEGETAYKAIKKDADGDGRPDLEQEYEGKELARQQMLQGMKAVKDPELVQTALVFLYTSWISVLATLKVQFARTTALALGIADCVKLPMTLVFGKALAFALGPDLKHWVDTIIDTSVKIIAVICAWQIQVVISAFYSGLRGGRMFAESAIHLLEEKGYLKSVPDFLAPRSKPVEGKEDESELDMDSTYLDEILMFPLAAIGFWYQLNHGFTFVALPLPIKLVLLPLEVIEWILEWKITWG